MSAETDPASATRERDARADALIRCAFAAYNRQDSEALLHLVTDDIEWPGDGDTTLHGKDQLRSYWARQWETTRTEDQVTDVTREGSNYFVAEISQTIRDVQGQVLSSGNHRYGFLVVGDRLQALTSRQA